MIDDPIVEEIRETRRQILHECQGDLERLIARLKAAEQKDQNRLVTADQVRKRASTREAAT